MVNLERWPLTRDLQMAPTELENRDRNRRKGKKSINGNNSRHLTLLEPKNNGSRDDATWRDQMEHVRERKNREYRRDCSSRQIRRRTKKGWNWKSRFSWDIDNMVNKLETREMAIIPIEMRWASKTIDLDFILRNPYLNEGRWRGLRTHILNLEQNHSSFSSF